MAGEPNYTAHVPWLEGKGRNDYSQFGEDGLIEECIECLGEKGLLRPGERFCFEVGAGDGRELSNTLRLRERGWWAVLIESADLLYKKLEAYNVGGVKTIHATATPDNFNQLLRGLPYDCDVGSIDIDGNDYWLFDTMVIRPRVMVVEFCSWRTEDHVPCRGESRAAKSDLIINGSCHKQTLRHDQATLGPIVELGRSKGYKFVAQTRCNAVFIYDQHRLQNAA